MQRESLWVSGSKAVAGALVATLTVRWAAVSTLTVPPEFLPLDGAAPTFFFTTVLGVAAVVVYAIVRRVSERPERTFRWIAVAALLLSLVPDLWLLTEGGEAAFAGATPTAVIRSARVDVWTLAHRVPAAPTVRRR